MVPSSGCEAPPPGSPTCTQGQDILTPSSTHQQMAFRRVEITRSWAAKAHADRAGGERRWSRRRWQTTCNTFMIRTAGPWLFTGGQRGLARSRIRCCSLDLCGSSSCWNEWRDSQQTGLLSEGKFWGKDHAALKFYFTFQQISFNAIWVYVQVEVQ